MSTTQWNVTAHPDNFDDAKSIISNFTAPSDALDNAVVHFAVYRCENYEGYASVVYEKDGKLWEVNGSHCSCYGLEGQWEPEETSWAVIAMRTNPQLKELAARFIVVN